MDEHGDLFLGTVSLSVGSSAGDGCCSGMGTSVGDSRSSTSEKAILLTVCWLVVRRIYTSGTVLDQMRPAATSTNHSADQNRRSAAHRVVRSVGKTHPASIGGMHPA